MMNLYSWRFEQNVYFYDNNDKIILKGNARKYGISDIELFSINTEPRRYGSLLIAGMGDNRDIAEYAGTAHDGFDKSIVSIWVWDTIKDGKLLINVQCKKPFNSKVIKRGKEMFLMDAIVDYINCQNSDGVGENGCGTAVTKFGEATLWMENLVAPKQFNVYRK